MSYLHLTRPLRLSACVALPMTIACSNGDERSSAAKLFDTDPGHVAVVTKTLSITPRLHSVEYEFNHVIDLLPMPNGAVWVINLDERDDGKNSTIQVFDSTGTIVRQVGAYGNGAGEYQRPYALTRLSNGRVAVRDNSFPERVLLYEADGSGHADMITDGRTGWPKLANFRWAPGLPDAIRADTFGVVWLAFDRREITTDSGVVYSSRYVRVRPGGQFIDVVDSPELAPMPESRITWTKVSPTGTTSVFGFHLPYQARREYALSPGAQFAVARTDRYQIDVMDMQVVQNPIEPGTTEVPRLIRTIKGKASTVRVEQAERDSILAQWKRDALARRLDSSVTFPRPAQTKPPIAAFRYSDDGQLLVWVAQPSVLTNGQWLEPQAIDVFDQTGHYSGRVNLPPSFQLLRFEGHTLWGATTVKGRTVPERFTIQW